MSYAHATRPDCERKSMCWYCQPVNVAGVTGFEKASEPTICRGEASGTAGSGTEGTYWASCDKATDNTSKEQNLGCLLRLTYTSEGFEVVSPTNLEPRTLDLDLKPSSNISPQVHRAGSYAGPNRPTIPIRFKFMA